MRSSAARIVQLVCLLLGAAVTSYAAEPTTQPNAAVAPVLKGMGEHSYPITTSVPEAQRFFDQGLVLAYAFNHAEAERAFREAGRLDPKAPMPWWGAALVLGPHYNSPMAAEAVPTAWESLTKARELAANGTEKERALIEALGHRYAQNPPEDRSSLDRAFADAMGEVAKAYPDDADIQAIYAESMMDLHPWDLYDKNGEAREWTPAIVQALERAVALSPRHPGANHLYIHAVEASSKPDKGLGSAQTLGDLVPNAGHLVHMPAHIYLRVGRYFDASEANVKAIAADESYLSQCAAQGFYPKAYYPHNIHFLWYSRSMEGRSAESLAAAREASKQTKAHCGVEAPSQRPLPLLAMARFGKWDQILAEPQPTSDLPFDVAIWHYAQGVALANSGKADEAAPHESELKRLAASQEVKALDSPNLPASQIMTIAQHDLAAEIAQARGQNEQAVEQWRAAVEAQDNLPYMEPPYWYLPERHALGAALLEMGRAAEAEEVYRADLKRNPHNGWALLGLSQALKAQGRNEQSQEAMDQFTQAWARADTKISNSRM